MTVETGGRFEQVTEEVDRVAKKQKISAEATDAYINAVIKQLQQAKQQLQGNKDASVESVYTEMYSNLSEEQKTSHQSTKEYTRAVNSFNKTISSVFEEDICITTRDIQMDRQTLNKVITEHFYREGWFDIADQFVKEAQVPGAEELKERYEAMHQVLAELRKHNLDAALKWSEGSREQLGGLPALAAFEFKLHRMKFLITMQQQGQKAALDYAKLCFGPFKSQHMRDIQRLMGCLVFQGAKPLEETPYADLLDSMQWQELERDFVRHCCSLLGQAYESPLLVAVAAGSAALPQLIKMQHNITRQLNQAIAKQDIKQCQQLPAECQIGPEFAFHSIFACPVSKDMSSAENPPKMLPCGHVLCQFSVLKIAKGPTRTFKCPYCPTETTPQNCRILMFPDLE